MVDVAAHAALAPVRVERVVAHAVQARLEQAGEHVRPRRGLRDRGRPDEPHHARRRDQVAHAAGVDQVAVELVRAGLQHRRLHAWQRQVQRVVDRDRAGREAVEPERAVAPRLRARPAQDLGDVLLRARPERVEATAAVAGPADLDEQLVVARAGRERLAVAAVGAELDDRRAAARSAPRPSASSAASCHPMHGRPAPGRRRATSRHAVGLRRGERRLLGARDLERRADPAADLLLGEALHDHPQRQRGSHPRAARRSAANAARSRARSRRSPDLPARPAAARARRSASAPQPSWRSRATSCRCRARRSTRRRPWRPTARAPCAASRPATRPPPSSRSRRPSAAGGPRRRATR